MLMAPPIFLALSVLSLLSIPPPSSPSPHGDALTLLSLRNSLTSPSSALRGWEPSNISSLCTSWRGISCGADGRVVSLDLSDMNLSGTVSSQLRPLDRLAHLSLSGNSLRGDLDLSRMPSLLHVNISGNVFSGSIDGWDDLPNLETLDAYDNNFTSRLPTGLPNCTRLRYLDLGGNFFYGAIPENYGGFRSIEFLSVAGNDLRGRIPASLANLSSAATIQELGLSQYNRFDGGLPAALGRLSSLRHLDASSCGLRGGIPTSLGGLGGLLSLYLHTNSLSGAIPPSLGNLTELTELDLSNNALTGEVPPELSRLRRLTLLNVFMNGLRGPVPRFVAELPELRTLGLFMNNFTGEIPEKLGSNTAIESVDLSSNRLTGMIPEGICSGVRLRVLILLKNFLFGGIPRGLGRCSTLVRVRLGRNYLNGSVPPGFLYLPRLDLVELQDNYLSGDLAENPRPPAERSRLGRLNLSNNLLSGPLPSSLSDLSSLQTLVLGGNRINGPIPTSIGSLRWLVQLDLGGNAISGGIPRELTRCSKLTYLDLSRNELRGPIPLEISDIAMLNYLNLSRNHLNGSVPRSIGVMASLTSADFSFNDLSGKLPTTGQFAYFNTSAFAGNPRLCGFPGSASCDDVAKTGTSSPRSPNMVKVSAGDWRIILALSVFVCCLAFAAAWAARARSTRGEDGYQSTSEWKMTAFCRVEFTADDVVGCMKEANVIGRGGAGVVYLCRLPGGGDVAVKRLMGGFGHRGGGDYDDVGYDHGFKAEVRTLGGIRHRNIVRLLAFCSNRRTNLLVYEYMRNGSLGTSLHGDGKNTSTCLGWERRYGIALEAARGLCYLHHDCSPMIVHRDVKSNNILLDSKLEAHVADFGLAKFLRDGGASECMSAIAGSYGYIAPEYAYTLKVDEKSDVYSYGVVLLELLTGRRPVGEFGEGVDVVHWAKMTTGSRGEHVSRIVDTRLTGVPAKEAAHILFLAMLCVHEDSVQRPTMREVVQMLSEFPRPRGEEQSSVPESTVKWRSPSTDGKDSNACYMIFN